MGFKIDESSASKIAIVSKIALFSILIAYFITGVELYFEKGNHIGLLFFIIFFLNLFILIFYRKNKDKVNGWLNLINAAGGFLSGYIFFTSGGQIIPYIYIFIGLIFIFISVMSFLGKNPF